MIATSATVLVLFLVCSVQSARILGVFPLPGKSHYFLGSALMRGLAERGHDITVISPFGEAQPPTGGSYRDVLLTGMLDDAENKRKEVNMFEMGDLSPFINIPFIAYLTSDMAQMTLEHENVQKLINSGEKFDAVIVEQIYNDAHKALATHFGGVQIVFSTIGANFWTNPLVSNPSPPSYVPDSLLSYSGHMTFCERLTNSLVYLLNQAVHHLYIFPKQNRVIQKYIPGGPHIDDVLYNASLVLLNSHPSLSQAVPHVPNMVEIGGFHVKPPEELPEDWRQFLDGAQEGVIYFSMGSNLRSIDLPVEKREAILRAFSRLKQKVLWKWEDEALEGQPPNVILSKWWPQQAILNHPNVKLFITHGGLLSTTEAIYYGVPVLVIPIFGDQKLNAQTAVNGGFGLSLPYRDLDEEALIEKLSELLGNPKYGINAKSKSRIFHDRMVKPLDEATYWVEYVIRHGGAPHLRVAGLDLPWYKYHLLDVIGFVALVSLIGSFVAWVVLKRICKKLWARRKQKKVKKN